MYFFLIASGFCVVYAFLYLLFPLFFTGSRAPANKRSLLSIACIIFIWIGVWHISGQIPDLDWSNRFLHVFGGGFLSSLICFLVVLDSKLSITKFRFFVFSFLIVLSLGVANEILEYFLQEFTSLSFANTANDTWMDLISNTVGALIALVCLAPFIRPAEKGKISL